jgi:hypothetical protein
LQIGNITISGPVTVNDVVIKGVDPDNGFTSEDVAVKNLGSGNGYAIRTSIFDGGNQLVINADGSINVSGFTSAIVGLKNVANVQINPATEDTLSGIKTQTDKLTFSGTRLEVDITGSVSVSNFPAIQPVSGTVTANQGTSPWVVSGSVSVSNLPSTQTIAISQTGTDNNVDANITNATLAVTQSGLWSTGRTWALAFGTDSINAVQSTSPWVVSGTVTANIGTTNGLALDSSLTTIDNDIKASQPRKLQDGSGNNITSQVSGSQRALDVGINVAGVQVDPRAIRALTSSDVVTANQGGAPWSVSQSGTWNINNISGTVSVSKIDLQVYRTLNLVATASNVKSSAGKIFGWHLYTTGTAERFIKFYDKDVQPVVGTDTPKLTIGLKTATPDNQYFNEGIPFQFGIWVACTTGAADNNTTSPTANTQLVHIFYQ